VSKGKMRIFKSGATRDDCENKNDYEGYLSPLFLESFGNYMTIHRKQSDRSLRDSDNWQRGIPLDVYIKSLWRHFMDLWFLHRGYKRYDKKTGKEITIEETCCAIFFNVQGYAHETLKGIRKK